MKTIYFMCFVVFIASCNSSANKGQKKQEEAAVESTKADLAKSKPVADTSAVDNVRVFIPKTVNRQLVEEFSYYAALKDYSVNRLAKIDAQDKKNIVMIKDLKFNILLANANLKSSKYKGVKVDQTFYNQVIDALRAQAEKLQ